MARSDLHPVVRRALGDRCARRGRCDGFVTCMTVPLGCSRGQRCCRCVRELRRPFVTGPSRDVGRPLSPRANARRTCPSAEVNGTHDRQLSTPGRNHPGLHPFGVVDHCLRNCSKDSRRARSGGVPLDRGHGSAGHHISRTRAFGRGELDAAEQIRQCFVAGRAAKATGLASDQDEAIEVEIRWQLDHMTEPVRTALRRLPLLGDDPAGPLGSGLLASGVLGSTIRKLQAGLVAPG